jgi:hypothetical protein
MMLVQNLHGTNSSSELMLLQFIKCTYMAYLNFLLPGIFRIGLILGTCHFSTLV